MREISAEEMRKAGYHDSPSLHDSQLDFAARLDGERRDKRSARTEVRNEPSAREKRQISERHGGRAWNDPAVQAAERLRRGGNLDAGSRAMLDDAEDHFEAKRHGDQIAAEINARTTRPQHSEASRLLLQELGQPATEDDE